MLSVFDRTPSVGGNYTVEEAYNCVFKPLRLEINKLGVFSPEEINLTEYRFVCCSITCTTT